MDLRKLRCSIHQIANRARQFHARMHFELAVDMSQVAFHCMDADRQFVRDLYVLHTLRGKARDFHFASRQRIPEPLTILVRGGTVGDLDR